MNKSWGSKILFNWSGIGPHAFLAFIYVLVLTLLLSACDPGFGSVSTPSRPLSSQLDAILKAGVIVIATDPSAPPQSQLIKNQPRAEKTRCSQTQYTANQMAGFDVEVAKETALRLGVEPCFVTPTWSQIVTGNWGDLWNVTVQSMVITPERMEKLYFTQPYIYGEAVLFVHKENENFRQPADLSGKRIGVCAGCAYESYLRGTLQVPGENIENFIKDPVIVGYDTDLSALIDLAAGNDTNLEAVLTDPDTGQAAIRSGLPVKQLTGTLYHDYDAMAVDKKSSADPVPLVKKLTEIILQMHQDQTLLKLSQQFYGGDFTSLAAQYDVKVLGKYPESRSMKNGLKSWRKSLTNRLAGIFLMFLLITIILIGYIVYVQATQSLMTSVFDRLSAVATLKEDGLNRWIDQQRLNIVFTAWQPDIQQDAGHILNESATDSERIIALNSLSAYLTNVVTSISDSDELFILDLKGNVVLSTQPEHVGQNHASDPFFTQGMFTTFIQPVYTSPDTGRPSISMSTPLFNGSKRRVGVLGGHLNLARIDRIFLERNGLGASGETYLVNSSHEFVSAALNNRSNTVQPGSIRSLGIDAALQGTNGKGLYTNYSGTPVLGVYFWLEDQQMALVAEISQDEAFAPARQLALTIFEYGLVAAVILAVIAFFLARRITRPILAITQVANLVAAGDLTRTAPVMTDDEVGLLAHTFNEMTAQLQILYAGLEKKVAERTLEIKQVNDHLKEEIDERKQAQQKLHKQNEYLAALHETTIGMISRLDLQDLFEALVLRAGQLLDTQDGFIYIVDPEINEIECKVGVGIFSRLVGIRVAQGEGLGGTVWISGQPLVVNDYDNWPDRVKNLEFNLIRSIIGIPLKHGDEVVGVIGLAYSYDSKPEYSFGENEIELLSRFAQLASIALDNARLYQVMNEARSAAEEANESKSAFLANVSHELRTPLTSILGFAWIIQKRMRERIIPAVPSEDPKVQLAISQVEENLKIVLSEGARLTALINDVLDLEKIRAGKMVWHMAPVKIGEIVDQASAATSSLLENKGLAWVKEIPAGLPVIMGDSDRLVQVLINLISNAVKFTEKGTITCRIVTTPDELVIGVIDQGIGIAKEDQTLVFEKFRQVGDTLTNKPKGTGLGLPICKEIVEHHGGKIWLESQPGMGSSFFFSLPV